MFNLKKRYKYVKDKIKKEQLDKDEEGREIVDITITDSDNLLSVYHPDGKAIIGSDMSNIIDNAIKATSHKKDIQLRFTCEKFTPDKESIYKNAIKNYYINEFADKERKLRNNMILTLTLFILAVISFTALFFVQRSTLPWIVIELIDIIAWVFSCETVDLLFFQRQLIKFEQNQDLQVIFAQITFITLEEKRQQILGLSIDN